MLGSRRERFASIFKRVKGMIEKGALDYEDRPLWYDVYKAFPPRVDPSYDRPCPTTTVQNIIYPEDCERAAFFKGQHRLETLNMFNLVDNRSTLSKLLRECRKLREVHPDLSSEEILSLAEKELKQDETTNKQNFDSA
ncbi:unnamed protein product [Schistosoma rodhaini]|uniref:Small ribosomal subunit protein mS23 n=1 Tax=Schistosoma rodhaini TaxID=6188 RepID=A0A183QVY7_9TREM|nr:unnamed protein product [Schistosoma rodhaini]CAH8472561.1 unnamed protein product [Schistosoma rodhaini]